ncbi:MAG: hypothetical protein M1831_006248 [Alyxoria varia]|nr:MAG: hypothetical protein M1831_006248 [Alyxoria varia]
MPDPPRICCLISGNGSNLQALIDAVSSGRIANAQINHVVCNREGAYGRQRARNAGIKETYHNLVKYSKKYPSGDENVKHGKEAREAYDSDLASIVLSNSPHLVVCAGWMHILSSAFLDRLDAEGVKVVNLHPALPGEFNGANAIQRAYEAYQKGEITRTGVMTHYVIREVDMGEPIVTREISFKQDESLDDFEKRLHEVEHQVIVDGTAKALSNLK